jgi:lipopolysaccharide export system permease protein
MRLSTTLSYYLARQLTFGILTAFFTLAFLIFLVDLVELGRRAAGDSDATFGLVFHMGLLHLPYLAQRVVPYGILLGSMLALARASRNGELVVSWASGISTWQLLVPGVGVALAIGIIVVTAFNPFAAALLGRYEQLDGKHLRNQVSNLAVSSSGGLWLRQADGHGESVIHAQRIEPPELILSEVIIFRYKDKNQFFERIDAASATLRDGYWELTEALITGPDLAPDRRASYRFDTELTVSRIQESFASPETLSFWEIPAFVALLERAGFSGLKHRVHWHKTLASPLLFAGMILIGAVFSLRMTRFGSTGLLIGAGVLAGFALYIFSDIVLAFGLSGRIPAVMSAWIPAIVSVLIGSGMILYTRNA